MNEPSIRRWKIGDVTITQIVELVMPEGLPGLLPDSSPGAILAIPWLGRDAVTEKGELTLSLHAFVIESAGKRIVVDTCIGNDKQFPVAPFWSQLGTSFLDRMRAAGLPPESIDLVVCTHLHIDHVGWNTHYVDGVWRATFPNARYLFGRVELEHTRGVLAAADLEPAWRETNDAVYRVSLEPVLAAGLVDLVETDHRLTHEVSLRPAPGHTPGHVTVAIQSAGASALVTGDAVHHPCQLAYPEWGSSADHDRALSHETRRALFEEALAGRQLVLGTHWPGRAGGYVVRDGAAFRLENER